MKPFNLEEAKAGATVQTHDGRTVRILSFDRYHSNYPIVALVRNNNGTEDIGVYDCEGFHNINPRYPEHNLYMKTIKKTGWINIYNDCIGYGGGYIYATREKCNEPGVGTKAIACVQIEWEE